MVLEFGFFSSFLVGNNCLHLLYHFDTVAIKTSQNECLCDFSYRISRVVALPISRSKYLDYNFSDLWLFEVMKLVIVVIGAPNSVKHLKLLLKPHISQKVALGRCHIFVWESTRFALRQAR